MTTLVNSTASFDFVDWQTPPYYAVSFKVAAGPQVTTIPSEAAGTPTYADALAAGLIQVITQASSAILVGSATSQAAALSTTGSPHTIAITNIGVLPGYVALGNSSVVATT